MGLHIYDEFYRVIYLDGTDSLIFVDDDIDNGFFINDTFVECPSYAIRLVISFMILLECQKNDYDFNLFCIIKDDKLLDNVDLLKSLKEVNGVDLTQEARLVKLFSVAYKERFPTQYFTVAETCGVLEGFVLLSQLFFQGDEE